MKSLEKTKRYERAIPIYGYPTLLMLLEEYEALEDFEECACIISAINRFRDEYDTSIPTRWGKEAIKDYRAAFWRLGFSGDVAIKNLPHYVNELKKYCTD